MIESKNPIVSVIVPVYNTEIYLEECLDSLINQTLEDIEIICIDDNSEDNSLKILEYYAKKDNRIKIIKNTENLGLAATRNRCLEVIKGKFVSFIDSDDKIDLDTYEKLYKFNKKFNQDVILFNAVRFNSEGVIWKSILHSHSIKGETIGITNINKNKEFIYDTSSCNKFIKTAFLKEKKIKFKENIVFEDLLFSMTIFSKTNLIGVYPDVKYYWRVRGEENNKSITQNYNQTQNLKDRIFVAKEIAKIFNSDPKFKELIKPYHEKLIEIDFLHYINNFDVGDEEYKNIIKTEIKDIVKTFDEDDFNTISNFDKAKYNLLLNENFDDLSYIVEKEKEYKNMIKEKNQKQKELRKTIKKRQIQNKKLKEKNKTLKEKNKQQKAKIQEYKSRKLVKIADKLKF